MQTLTCCSRLPAKIWNGFRTFLPRWSHHSNDRRNHKTKQLEPHSHEREDDFSSLQSERGRIYFSTGRFHRGREREPQSASFGRPSTASVKHAVLGMIRSTLGYKIRGSSRAMLTEICTSFKILIKFRNSSLCQCYVVHGKLLRMDSTVPQPT